MWCSRWRSRGADEQRVPYTRAALAPVIEGAKRVRLIGRSDCAKHGGVRSVGAGHPSCRGVGSRLGLNARAPSLKQWRRGPLFACLYLLPRLTRFTQGRGHRAEGDCTASLRDPNPRGTRKDRGEFFAARRDAWGRTVTLTAADRRLMAPAIDWSKSRAHGLDAGFAGNRCASTSTTPSARAAARQGCGGASRRERRRYCAVAPRLLDSLSASSWRGTEEKPLNHAQNEPVAHMQLLHPN